MRKFAVSLGLVLVVLLVTVLAVWVLLPNEPRLRVGMSEEEVRRVLGPTSDESWFNSLHQAAYPVGPDVFGNQGEVIVMFTNGRVEKWRTEPTFHTQLHWLKWVMKWVG